MYELKYTPNDQILSPDPISSTNPGTSNLKNLQSKRLNQKLKRKTNITKHSKK